jgi:hypothetical protein
MTKIIGASPTDTPILSHSTRVTDAGSRDRTSSLRHQASSSARPTTTLLRFCLLTARILLAGDAEARITSLAPWRPYKPGDAALPVVIAGDIPAYWKPPIRLRPFTPIFTPTHPNIILLRPTRPDEDTPEIRIPMASSDINRHPDTH